MAKKIFKPAAIVFNILSLLSFFVIGVLFAKLIDAGKGAMLAAGAIVLGYGVLFAGIAFILSFVFTYRAKHRYIVIGNIIFTLFLLGSYGYFHLEYKKKQKEQSEEQQEQIPTQPTAPAENGQLLAMNTKMLQPSPTSDQNMGLGYFVPNFYENPTFYFYGQPNLEKSIMEHVATDSIVFKRLEQGGFDIEQAPPWLVPEHMKLDYDLLYFQLKSIGREFVELVVNNSTGRTAYVDKNSGKIMLWPEFLLIVQSVEFPQESNQNIKERPFEASGNSTTPYSFMRPILIQNDWMKVELWDDNYKKVGEGWVRWRENGQLLITYSLLS